LGGYFRCLKYAHENGCPWDERTSERAVKGGWVHCLLYVIEKGCPWNEKGRGILASEFGYTKLPLTYDQLQDLKKKLTKKQ